MSTSSVASVRWNIPAHRDDEDLFSLASRIHYASGARSPRETSTVLFGSETSEVQTGLPSGLKWLWGSGLLAEAFIDIDHIIDRTTLFPYFTRVRRPADLQRIKDALLDGKGSVKAVLGLLASRIRSRDCLRWCPMCVAADMVRYGSAHWRRSHQLPCVTCCAEHRVLLSRMGDLRRRLSFCLPPVDIYRVNREATLVEQVFSAGSAVMLRGESPAGPPAYASYAEELLDKGYARGTFVDLECLSRDIRQFYEGFSFLEGTGEIHMPSLRRLDWLPALYRTQRGSHHPVYHVLLREFLRRKARAGSSVTIAGRGQRRATRDQEEIALRTLRRVGTLRAAAAASGLSVATVDILARKGRIAIRRRAKVLNPKLTRKIAAQLGRGFPLKAVAASAGVSVVTVRRIVAGNPKLRRHRAEQSNRAERRTRRAEARETLRKWPRIGRNAFRRAKPALYIWLYRNDREWLGGLKFSKGMAPKPRELWARRDQWTAAQIRRHAKLLSTEGSLERRTFALFARKIKTTAWIPQRLDRMPETARVLARLIETRPEHRHRRFEAAFEMLRTAFSSPNAIPTFSEVMRAAGINYKFESFERELYEALARGKQIPGQRTSKAGSGDAL